MKFNNNSNLVVLTLSAALITMSGCMLDRTIVGVQSNSVQPTPEVESGPTGGPVVQDQDDEALLKLQLERAKAFEDENEVLRKELFGIFAQMKSQDASVRDKAEKDYQAKMQALPVSVSVYRESLNQATQALPENAKIQTFWGDYWQELFQFAEMIRPEDLARVVPGVSATQLLLSARDAWTKSVELNPNDYRPYYQLGMIYVDNELHPLLGATDYDASVKMGLMGVADLETAETLIAKELAGDLENQDLRNKAAVVTTDVGRFYEFYQDHLIDARGWSKPEILNRIFAQHLRGHQIAPQNTIANWYYVWAVWIYKHEGRETRLDADGRKIVPMTKAEAQQVQWQDVLDSFRDVFNHPDRLFWDEITLKRNVMLRMMMVFTLDYSVASGKFLETEFNALWDEYVRVFTEEAGYPPAPSVREFYDRGIEDVKKEII